MTMMPEQTQDYEGSPDHERIPLAHGLSAVIIRYPDDEPRPERPKLLPPSAIRAAEQQASFRAWQAEQSSAHGSPRGGGAA